MAGAQFEYDERGGTFYYFLISFYAILLIPATYYFFTKKKDPNNKKEKDLYLCQCEGCQNKASKKKSEEPWFNFKRRLAQFFLLLAWVGFFLLAYKVAHLEVEGIQFDPFKVLGLDPGATDRQIKKAYYVLSKTEHPDKGGDPDKFVLISKAYQALTDAEAKKNYEQYGNPDGPGATTFGIALPKWLVSKEYGIWVLAVYGLIFMIILPSVVGVWWYNSIKYSADQVLMDTTHLYGYMFHKTSNMILKRIIMVLGASFEYSKMYNKEVVERPSDDKEVLMLIKELPNLNEKNKEKPLCYPYSIKARALLHAHLSRIPLPPNTLECDRELILRKTPILLQEMIQVVQQLVMLAAAGRVQRMPSVETVENVIKLSPMLVQGLWDKQSPLLQLPHFTEDMLRYCVTKKRRVKTCGDLAGLDEKERRSLFRNLGDDQYEDIGRVLAGMPTIQLSYRVEVQGEDDKEMVTAGSLVTVRVHLTRRSLMDQDGGSQAGDQNGMEEDEDGVNEEEVNDEDEPEAEVVKRKPWEKPPKKSKNKQKNAANNRSGGGKKGGNAGSNQSNVKKGAVVGATVLPTTPQPSGSTPSTPKNPTNSDGVDGKASTESPSSKKSSGGKSSKRQSSKQQRKQKDSDDEYSDESGSSGYDDSEDEVRDAIKDMNTPETDDEDDLVFGDELIKKERILETKSKITHPVHCPYFPADKYEWWWVYLCDRKHKVLIAGPVSVTTLTEEEEVELKFPAPGKPGNYSFQLCLRSDSYIDADMNRDLKLEVGEQRVVTEHPQWASLSEDENDKSESEQSDGSEYTEDEDEEDDD